MILKGMTNYSARSVALVLTWPGTGKSCPTFLRQLPKAWKRGREPLLCRHKLCIHSSLTPVASGLFIIHFCRHLPQCGWALPRQ